MLFRGLPTKCADIGIVFLLGSLESEVRMIASTKHHMFFALLYFPIQFGDSVVGPVHISGERHLFLARKGINPNWPACGGQIACEVWDSISPEIRS